MIMWSKNENHEFWSLNRNKKFHIREIDFDSMYVDIEIGGLNLSLIQMLK